MPSYEDLLVAVEDRITTITLNRPDKLNATTRAMADGLLEAIAAAAVDPAVRVIVITGAGRAFCAGADMQGLQRNSSTGTRAPQRPVDPSLIHRFDSELGPDLGEEFQDIRRYAYFMRVRKPIIAAVNGPAAGMGLVLALCADLRFAAEPAIFTTSFAQRGLVAEHGTSWLLPRLVGPAHALDLLLSARRVKADEAKRMGLVNDVFPLEGFLDNVRKYAIGLANMVSPRSMAVIKRQVWASLFQGYTEALAIADAELELSVPCPDYKEGVAHFLEKRPARFPDLA